MGAAYFGNGAEMMTKIRAPGEAVRRFVVENVEAHGKDIARFTAKAFGITTQAVHWHLKNMATEGLLVRQGRTRSCTYSLATFDNWAAAYRISGYGSLSESEVFVRDIRGAIGALPENAARIWEYGFTEMMNNAIDHSDGTVVHVSVAKTAASIRLLIADDGVGIFRKIQRAFNLADERHAILELAKGKCTTDPARHTGQGIFFTSRMFDGFDIASGDVFFTHDYQRSDYCFDGFGSDNGTVVFLRLNNHTSRTTARVFDEYSESEEGASAFSKTVIPVRLATIADENLVSRSQAKRLLARVEMFNVVLFDFEGVNSIGQAFADEVFRVFQAAHPHISITPIRCCPEVSGVIARAAAGISPAQLSLPLRGDASAGTDRTSE